MEKRETNEKQYYSRTLDEILSRYIDRGRYGDFSVILKDIFQRRAYEFDFSEAHIEREVANFVQRAQSVEFVPKEKMTSETAMGVYVPRESTIRINQDFYSNLEKRESEFDFGSKMYETLTHEVYHAISDYGGRLGLMYWDRSQNSWPGAALNEIFTETAANRASMPRGAQEAEHYRAETDGYSDITFVTNLLAASVGVTEKELLRAGVQNRGELMSLICSKFPQDSTSYVANQMQKLEANLDIIYNIRYHGNTSKTPAEHAIDSQLLGTSISNLYGTAFQLASYQIANDGKEISEQTVADAQYRYLKMSKIMEDSVSSFEQTRGITPEIRKSIYTSTVDIRKQLADTVIGMNAVNREGYKISNPNDLMYVTNMAKAGKIRDVRGSLDQFYGIKITDSSFAGAAEITNDLEYTSYVMREDFDDGKQWDNHDAAVVMKKIFVEDMERKGLRSKKIDISKQETEELPVIDEDKTEEIPIIEDESKKGFFGKLKEITNNIITRLKNRNQPKLNAGNLSRENDNSEYYANLVSGSAKTELENTLDQYKVNVDLSELHIKDINSKPAIETKKEIDQREDDEGR